MQAIKVITALDQVTATTVSSKIWIGDFDRVALLFRAAAISTGNGVFTVKAGFAQLASDTPTVTAYSMLIDNVANTNAQTLTRVASKTLSSNVDVMVWLSPEAMATHLEITATRTTDGTYSAYIIGFNQVQS